MDNKYTKLIMGGVEHVAIPQKDIEDLYQRAYKKGYSDGWEKALKKFFPRESKS